MREILFRGKTTKGKWVYGYPNIYDDESINFVVGKLLNSLLPMEDCCVDIEYDTLGQFTGLTDKNGKKIFEGDIVAYNELHIDGKEYQEIGYFECDEHYVSFRIHGKNMTPFYCEVIGNIYDNKELLGE